nr:vacuolar protein-sorting-associated protein 11 like [Quercus suber]
MPFPSLVVLSTLTASSVPKCIRRSAENRKRPANVSEIQQTAHVAPALRFNVQVVDRVQHPQHHPSHHEVLQAQLSLPDLGLGQQASEDARDEQRHVLQVVTVARLGALEGRELLLAQPLTQLGLGRRWEECRVMALSTVVRGKGRLCEMRTMYLAVLTRVTFEVKDGFADPATAIRNGASYAEKPSPYLADGAASHFRVAIRLLLRPRGYPQYVIAPIEIPVSTGSLPAELRCLFQRNLPNQYLPQRPAALPIDPLLRIAQLHVHVAVHADQPPSVLGLAPLQADDDVIVDERNTVSCIIAGTTNVIAGTPDGVVHLLDPSFKSTRSWKAHATGGVTHARQIPETAYLITIAEDLSQEPELKVWSFDQSEKKTGHPKCLCTIPVQNGRKNFPITAFSVTSDLTQVAVGFGNGAVTVVRGDFVHDRGTKQRTVFESEEPITGLEFREANTTALYIGTTSRVLALAISGKAKGTAARTLDENGCAVGCMTMDSRSNEIVVARDDAIYTFGPRGKGVSYPYDCTKELLDLYKDYVLLVSPPNDNLARNSLHAFGGLQATEIASNSTFTILNTNFKFIAHTELISSRIRTFFSIWGDVFLLSIDGKIFRYREKTFQQKLEILYKRNQYLLAIDLAREYKVDAVQQNIIYRKFGDYLYRKGDYDTAMQQYLHAIDNTEPSQIIRKFLDNQRIRNLIEYLEELHEHHKATSDHTTLLLNCYAKLKDVEKLENFIKQPGDLKFDLDTAIVMCRQGGYYDQAAFLARRHIEHGLVVDILVEDLKKYAEALAYVVRLEPADAYASLMKFGTVLLAHCSRDATQLFIDYFTGQFRPKKDAVIVQEVPVASESGGFGSVARSAVQNLAALIPLPNMSTTLMQSSTAATQPTQSQVVETIVENDFVEYTVPKPRVAFSSFIDHPECFIVFLEACIASSGVEAADKADLYTTLFEMYLHQASSSRTEEKTEWERKAKSLIESKSVPIDTSNVLLLSDLEKFQDGTILVSERQGLLFDVFRSYTSANDTPWRTLLRRLEILEEAGDEVDVVLKKIDEDALMAPLQVIQCLSTNAVATMGLVKRYLSSTVERERAEIAANRKVITSYRHDTAQKLQDISDLDTKPTAFSATRCSTCAMALDLPTVHFLCKHSFHQRCLNIADGQELEEIECPICAPQNQTVRQIQRLQEESSGRHELFLDALNGSQDRFGTIGDWFAKGVISVPGAVSQ